MNTVDELAESLTPDMASDLKRAIELGIFPDGRAVTRQQKELMLGAIIHYDALNVPECNRTGFIQGKEKIPGISDSLADLIPSRRVDND